MKLLPSQRNKYKKPSILTSEKAQTQKIKISQVRKQMERIKTLTASYCQANERKHAKLCISSTFFFQVTIYIGVCVYTFICVYILSTTLT